MRHGYIRIEEKDPKNCHPKDLYKNKVVNMHGEDVLIGSIVINHKPFMKLVVGSRMESGHYLMVLWRVKKLREVQVNRSLSSSKRQRIQHDKRIAQHNELMKAHAQSMVDWGESVQATVESNLGGVSKFLMTIASLQGIPGPEIPCITIPPPPTFPTLTTSSPIFSPEMPSTGESANAAEHMDNTWCGAENGMFGGFFDANGNDANGVPVENFSPSCDDLPPF